MPSRNTVEIIINAKDTASNVLGGVGGALQGLGKVALGATTVVAGAAVGIGAAIGKLAADAAPLEGVSAAFEGLANSAGIGASEMLAALEEGSAGMISQRDLMTSFNKAAQLVSVDFAQTMPDAMSYLGKVAASTGQDMGFLLDSLVTGVGRLSPMILDNLGIQVSLTEAMEDWSEANGVAVADMTKQQQQAALTAQVMEKLAENTAAMPDVAGGAAAGMAQMQATIQNLKDQIGLAFIPVLQAVLEPILDIAEDAGPKLIEWAQVAGEWLGENIPIAIEYLKGVWAEMWPVIQGAIETAWPIIQEVFVTIQDWMTNEGPSALATLQTAFTEVWAFLQEITGVFVTWFQENLPLIQQTAQTLVDFFQTHVAPTLDNVWEIIKTVVTTAIQSILSIIKVAMQIITGDWTGAWKTIQDNAAMVTESIRTIIQEFIEGVLNSVGTTTEETVAIWRNNWEMAKTIVQAVWENIVSSITAKINEIKSFLSNQVAAFKQIGEDLMEGLKRGIMVKVQSILGAIRETIQNIIDTAKSALQESSPSMVFAEIGENISAGLALGISGARALPIAATSSVVGDTINTTNNFNMTVNTQTDVSTVVQDFATMRAMVRA